MTIAFMIILVFLGVCIGYAAHQTLELIEARHEISGCRQEELRLSDTIATLRAEVKAHETTLNMIMEEAAREND